MWNQLRTNRVITSKGTKINILTASNTFIELYKLPIQLAKCDKRDFCSILGIFKTLSPRHGLNTFEHCVLNILYVRTIKFDDN